MQDTNTKNNPRSPQIETSLKWHRIYALVSLVALALGIIVGCLMGWLIYTKNIPEGWNKEGLVVMAILGMVMAVMGLLSFLNAILTNRD